MHALIERLVKIQNLIYSAEQKYARPASSVKLLAASKSQPIAAIKTLVEAGQYEFGENYVQEAVSKMQLLADPRIIWHFIGRIQTNKTRAIATHFSWVHSLCSLKQAEKLAEYRPISCAPLNVCIEVNLDEEPQKAGVALSEAPAFAKQLLNYPTLRLRGLMTLPAIHDDFADQRRVFHELFLLFTQLKQNGIPLDTLSMGMSHDFEAAVAEGATIVRIGTAIFGPR